MARETLQPFSRVLDSGSAEASELTDDLRQVVQRCLAGDEAAMCIAMTMGGATPDQITAAIRRGRTGTVTPRRDGSRRTMPWDC